MVLLLLEAWKHCMPGRVTYVCRFRPCSAGARRQQRGRWAARVEAQRAEGATRHRQPQVPHEPLTTHLLKLTVAWHAVFPRCQ
jgi:hypothetical protein